ncbi:MAG: Ppx/GppA phosphatase family protein [Planctomycetota bacterium]
MTPDQSEPPTGDQPTLWPRERIAAIDIGSNSVRLVVAQVEASGGYRVLDEERENTRLAGEIDKTGRLGDAAVEATFVALRNFLSIANGYDARQVRAIATSAVRDANNGPEFCERAAKELGLLIDVISPREEARLAYLSVARAFDVTDRPVAVADIGGGSTEIVFAKSGLIDEVFATRLGAVRIAEKCQLVGAATTERLADAEAYVDRQLKKVVGKLPFVPAMLYGTGGTFTAMASVLLQRRGEREAPARGYQVDRAQVRHLMLDLAKMTLEKRRKVAGLNPRRADIIVAGLLVIDRILRRLQVNTVQVHTRGVRDGLLLTMIRQSPGRVVSQAERWTAIERFASNCGVDLNHARQAARIAGLLLDQLAEPLGIDPHDRQLIEAAAMLANVGYLINFDKHHKHSFHLILNSELIGFERRDLLLVAHAARYHRGSAPKQKHRGYADLEPEDQQRVAEMAAILRLALALDRTHQQQVQDLRCQVIDDRVEVAVKATGDAEVDLWAARRKVELFEQVFGKQLFFASTGGQPIDQPSKAPEAPPKGGADGTDAVDACPGPPRPRV